jgi:hypothetical protein
MTRTPFSDLAERALRRVHDSQLGGVCGLNPRYRGVTAHSSDLPVRDVDGGTVGGRLHPSPDYEPAVATRNEKSAPASPPVNPASTDRETAPIPPGYLPGVA